MTSNIPYVIYIDEPVTYSVKEMIAISRVYINKKHLLNNSIVIGDINE